MESLIRFRASEHFLWRHEHVRAHIADEVVLDRAAARLLLVEQIPLLRELRAGALHRRAREPQGPGQLVELQVQGKLPVRGIRPVEEILPECLCARRQRPDRHHLVEVAELRDEARHRFLGHRNTPFIKHPVEYGCAHQQQNGPAHLQGITDRENRRTADLPCETSKPEIRLVCWSCKRVCVASLLTSLVYGTGLLRVKRKNACGPRTRRVK